MKLEIVTITGADDQVDVQQLYDLQLEFPFVEWGILLSATNQGQPRYPWGGLLEIAEFNSRYPLRLSGHICSNWMQDILNGYPTIISDKPFIQNTFDRIQLNCHNRTWRLKEGAFLNAIDQLCKERSLFKSYGEYSHGEYILPWDGQSQDYLPIVTAEANASLLFDTSGGKGESPKEWPAISGWTGFAGGLTPDNLETQLIAISKIAGDCPFWIDVESGVRTDNQFDFKKVRSFLKTAAICISALQS